MAKFNQGVYYPTNMNKYLGKSMPRYRSSWELRFMQFCDNNTSVVGWASESHRIPYINPITRKLTTYVPDFFVVYIDKDGKQHAEMIEVKPSSQILENARSRNDKLVGAINEAKWQMARLWCKQNGIFFRVITENDIFRSPKRSRNK